MSDPIRPAREDYRHAITHGAVDRPAGMQSEAERGPDVLIGDFERFAAAIEGDPMTDQTTARASAAEMAQRLEWAVDNEPGYGFLLRAAGEAAKVLRTLPGAPEEGDRADELKQLRDRDRLLRFYLAKIANKVGRPTTLTLDNAHDIEHIGEGVLAELERQESATLNSELKVRGATVDSESSVHSTREWETSGGLAGAAAAERLRATLDD